jgi:predicted alpha-1,2-mannosidase
MKHTDLVDCFHGVDGLGSCLPGPYRPFGMVRAGPDTLNPNPTGYASGQPLLRFSHTHVSGTGGSGRYGNIGVVPCPSRHGLNPFAFNIVSESARPGYYRAELKPGPVTAELTSTARAALHRYRFPSGEGRFGLDRPHIAIETHAVLCGEALDGEARWIDAQTCEGFGTLRGGWGHNHPFTVYFSAHFRSAPDKKGCVRGTDTHPEFLQGRGSTAVARFAPGTVVELEVGISFVSAEKARENRQREIAGRSFEAIVAESDAVWEERLSRFSARCADPEALRLYNTMLYRLFAMPDDLGGDECPWIPGSRRQFNNLYCLWDSVRNANSFFALWDPAFQADLCNALLDIADHTGWAPDAWIMGRSAAVQGGSSSDTLFCEAWLKNLPGFDAQAALAQMLRERATPSPDPRFQGRYPEYFVSGRLSDGVPQCLSRTLEYALQDDGLARMADALGQSEAAAAARARADGVWDLWNDDLKAFAPKTRDGSWAADYNPWKPQRLDFWADPHCYEGTGHEWSLTVLQDIEGLMRRHGGPEAFAAHLDRVFEHGFFLWKEIILHVPWLYHFAGFPARSAARVRECLNAHYKPGRFGLSDNEDMGSQSSFAIGALCGVYPVMGTDLYLLLPPVLDEVTWRVGPDQRILHIRKDAKLRGLTWRGEKLTRSWLRHAEIAEGGELVCGPVDTWNVQPPPGRA